MISSQLEFMIGHERLGSNDSWFEAYQWVDLLGIITGEKWSWQFKWQFWSHVDKGTFCTKISCILSEFLKHLIIQPMKQIKTVVAI